MLFVAFVVPSGTQKVTKTNKTRHEPRTEKNVIEANRDFNNTAQNTTIVLTMLYTYF